MWSLSLITAPAQEALDVSTGGEVYQHLRLVPELTPQDALIEAFAAAARQEGERISRRQFITATWELWLESWFEEGIFTGSTAQGGYSGWQSVGSLSCLLGALSLPLPPLQSITSVKYMSGGVEQTWSSALYTVEAPQGDFAQRGRLFPKEGQSWPGTDSPAGIKVRFLAGYGLTPATVPGLFRSAMLLLVGEAYERRELQSETSASPNLRSARQIFYDNRAW